MSQWVRAAFILSVLWVGGCAACRRPPSVSPCAEPCPAPETHRLAVIPFDGREPIQLAEWHEPHRGIPIAEPPTETLQDLTFQQCGELAARSSPIARALESERQILCGDERTPRAAVEILGLQAVHERNQAAGQALRAYLGLVEIYLQYELILNAKNEINLAADSLEKLRDAGVALAADEGEFERRQLELDERIVKTQHLQHQLTAQLEKLMSLDSAGVPLWTNFQSTPPIAQFDAPAELATAFANRKDLAAAQRLADGAGSLDLLDWMRNSAREISPLLGTIAARRGLLPARDRDAREREATERKCQLEAAVDAKRVVIELDVKDAIDSLGARSRVIDLKRQTIASLTTSLARAEKAKDLYPVDFQTDLENRMKLLTARSELVHELIEYESDLVRLRQAQGLLAGHSIGMDSSCVECLPIAGQ